MTTGASTRDRYPFLRCLLIQIRLTCGPSRGLTVVEFSSTTTSPLRAKGNYGPRVIPGRPETSFAKSGDAETNRWCGPTRAQRPDEERECWSL